MRTGGFRVVLFFIGLILSNYGFASTINEQTAKSVALNFFNCRLNNSRQTTLSVQLQYERSETDGEVDYYVYGLLPIKGFVIIAGNDNVIPIIGYSLESDFVIDANSSTGINNWLNNSAKKIHQVVLSGIQASGEITNLWAAYLKGSQPSEMKSASVGPLVLTTWDQSRRFNTYYPVLDSPFYYNSLCPQLGSFRCLAGCNAVTIAQIMKYWSYPPQGMGSNIDFSGAYGAQSADFSSTSYNWSIMPEAITSANYTTAGAHELDTLIYQCGVAVNMMYDTSSSNSSLFGVTNSALYAYVIYFGYDANTIKGVKADSMTSAAWINMIKDELNVGRVVQYRGDDSAGNSSHIWVCDGYDNNNDLHMNWGWGGIDNGYFQVGALNPGSDEFNSTDEAIIGIQPISVGIAQNEKTFCDIGISPNPCYEHLRIEITCAAQIKDCDLIIYGVLGEAVMKYKLELNSGLNEINLPVTRLASGSYFLSIRNGGEVITSKVIKMKF